jgi:hypothetical protein
MKFKVGTVKSKADITRTGLFKVNFGTTEEGKEINEPVRYVSPYGNNKEGFIALPPVGAQVLVVEAEEVSKKGDVLRGFYYLGSVMGAITGMNQASPLTPTEADNQTPDTSYVDKSSPGQHGPPLATSSVAQIKPEETGWLPERFKDMYDGKGIIPEAMGFANHRADTFKIADRYNNTSKASNPFQDYTIGIESGNGKSIQAVDSPIIDGIVMKNEHRGKDFFIWSSGMSKESTFSQGEWYMRTHGPVNMHSLFNRMHLWIDDGLNIEIENQSTPGKSYGPGENAGPPPFAGGMSVQSGLGSPYEGTRQAQFGNESTGCVQIESRWNNISAKALGDDSVIYVYAPEPNSKVIVETGGTVDISAEKKVTLQSKEAVEIIGETVRISSNSDMDVNARNNIYIDGAQVRMNDTGSTPPPPY